VLAKRWTLAPEALCGLARRSCAGRFAY
jgi:hypothetical protein